MKSKLRTQSTSAKVQEDRSNHLAESLDDFMAHLGVPDASPTPEKSNTAKSCVRVGHSSERADEGFLDALL